MQSVRDIKLFQNIPILVRTSLNVPLENGKVMNDYRLRRAVPTIRFLAEHGAKVVLISHIGEKGTETLAQVATAFGKLMPHVSFSPEIVGARVRSVIRDMAPSHILILENLRRNIGEQKNDPTFARELAALADVFVEDSFDTCHRAHSSIVGVPKLLPSYAGFLLQEEVAELSQALTPKRPSLAIIGGMKFATKEAVLASLLEKYDQVFVGGALANDFLKTLGKDVGKSLTSNIDAGTIQKILANPKLILPIDSVVVDGVIRDHGPGTSALLADLTKKAKTILWNGPLGNYENGFIDATDALARSIADSRAHSIVGGGDTVASIENLGLLSRFSFVSTGGGAMLDFLARGSLPGIDALD